MFQIELSVSYRRLHDEGFLCTDLLPSIVDSSHANVIAEFFIDMCLMTPVIHDYKGKVGIFY